MPTKLIYLEQMQQLHCEAKVVQVFEKEGRSVVLLDQTVFYPQGGGQPYDTGVVTSSNRNFIVKEVRFIDGMVHHIGTFESGPFMHGEIVTCRVDASRRELNTRLHSAGHIVDMGLKRLGIDWLPGKGYHFPAGPYVEYAGSLVGVDIEKLKIDLAGACNGVVQSNTPTTISFNDAEKVNGKPSRTVYYGDFGILCGGTHVANLAEVRTVVIRKIKPEKDVIRISYDVER